MENVIGGTNTKTYLEQVSADDAHLNTEEINVLLGLLSNFEDLFYHTLV